MKLIELVRLCECNRNHILKNVDVVTAYMLAKLLTSGNDSIPGVGNIILKKENNKKFVLHVELEEKWQSLLNDKNVTDVLTSKLINMAEEGGLDYSLQ